MAADPPAIIEFGQFSMLPHRRLLLADGPPITLGDPALQIAAGPRGIAAPNLKSRAVTWHPKL
jgi:hypothetical protein